MPFGTRAWLVTIIIGLLVVLPFQLWFDFPLWVALICAVPVGVVVFWVAMFIVVNRR